MDTGDWTGEIIAFAEVKQIEALFDTDLWQARRQGEDETFDAQRFAIWLEILCEIGLQKAVEKIIEMDEDFLVMSFCSLAWVTETEWLTGFCEVDQRLEKIVESKLFHEIDEFIIFDRSEQSWDTFVALLTEIDSRHHSLLCTLLSRCANIFAQDILTEDDLYEVLSSERQLIDDVAYEREKRREALGFVAPATARSFLKLCGMHSDIEDNITPRQLVSQESVSTKTYKKYTGSSPILTGNSRFKRVLSIFKQQPECHDLYSGQIHYLANLLLSGWDWGREKPRPGRALEIALEVCERGLKQSTEAFSSFPRAFRVGWGAWIHRTIEPDDETF